VRGVAGWGEHSARDSVSHFAATLDDLVRRIKHAIRTTPGAAARD
jgi:hypothetical protein